MANLLEGLLKTPQQIRDEQLRGLDEQGAAQAKLMTPGQTPFANWGAGQIARMPAAMNQAVRMGGQAAGSLASAVGASPEMINKLNQIGVSAEERQAMKMQDILKQAKGDAKGLRAAAQQLIKDGDPKNAYALLTMAKDLEKESGADILDTNDNKNILFIAKNQLKCDINDPKCLKAARDEYIRTKRADVAQQKMEVFGYEGLVAERDKAESAARSIKTANESLRILDSGQVNIGAFPATRQGAMKFASQLFGWEEGEETVARTAELMSQTKLLAGELLASGMFGTGTAISERDLRTAEEIAGASNTLTPASMQRVLELNAKMNQVKIDAYNQKLDRYSPEFYARTPEGVQKGFVVAAPDIYKSKPKEQPKENVQQVIFDDMMFPIPVGAQAGKMKGRYVYKLDGEYYDASSGAKLTAEDLK